MSVPDIHVCTALDQKFCHVAVPKPRCLVEQRVSLAVEGIYICTVVDEQLRHIKIPIVCGDMKWSQVVNVPYIQVCSDLGDLLCFLALRYSDLLVEWRVSLAVEGIYICTVVDEQLRQVKIPTF